MSFIFLTIALSALGFNIGINLYFRHWLNERLRKRILVTNRDIQFWGIMWLVVKLFMVISVTTGAMWLWLVISEK